MMPNKESPRLWNKPATTAHIRLDAHVVQDCFWLFSNGQRISSLDGAIQPTKGDVYIFATDDTGLIYGVQDGLTWNSLNTDKPINKELGLYNRHSYRAKEQNLKKSIYVYKRYPQFGILRYYTDATLKPEGALGPLPKLTCALEATRWSPALSISIPNIDIFEAMLGNEVLLQALGEENALINDAMTTRLNSPHSGSQQHISTIDFYVEDKSTLCNLVQR